MSVQPRAARREARTICELVARARTLAGAGHRRILGIAGPPGSGKSTLAAHLSAELGEDAVVVPMDGIHLSNRELVRLGRRERKGAPDTLDVAGYVCLLRRLRDGCPDTVYAPRFDRAAEMSLAGAIPVRQQVPLVLTEGNYLLLEPGGWGEVRPLLDEAWFLLPDEPARLERLIRRHIDSGKSPEAARDWSMGPGRDNGDLVMATRHRADVIVTAETGAPVPCP